MVVPGGGLDLDHTFGDLQQRHVERATTEVEDQDGLLFLALVQAVSQRSRGGLVDDPQDVEAGNLSGFLGGLALRVLEVGRHGDHRIGHVLTEVGLSVALELHQDPRTNLLRGVLLPIDRGRPVGPHVPLDRPDGAVHVGDRLVLGRLADEYLAVLGKGDHRRRRPRALRVRHHGGLAALEDSHDGVGGP
jgi:hypothetical protein